MAAIASTVFFGVVPPIGVAALRKRSRQSLLATVAKAASKEPRVFKFASVVFCVMLIGSKSTFPQVPVTGSTRLGTFPAAIRSPNGLPEMDSPLMKRAAVNAEATVVSSLITTFGGGALLSTSNIAVAAFSPPAAAMPPLETR